MSGTGTGTMVKIDEKSISTLFSYSKEDMIINLFDHAVVATLIASSAWPFVSTITRQSQLDE